MPIGFIGIALALQFIPEIRMQRPSPFDVPGFIIIAFGLGIGAVRDRALRPHIRVDPVTEVLLVPAQPSILLGYALLCRAPAPARCWICGCFAGPDILSPWRSSPAV